MHGPLIYFIKMKRFTRKGSKNRSQDQSGHRRQKTEADQYQQQSSQSTTKNISFQESSIDKKLFDPKPSALLIYSLLRCKIEENLHHGFKKIMKKSDFYIMKLKQTARAIGLTSKILYKLKYEGFNQLRSNRNKYELKNKGIIMLHNCSLGIVRKKKLQSLLRIINFTKSRINQENYQLKLIQLKYNENYIPEEFIKEFRKFIRINPKNIKNFIKNSEQIIEPALIQIIKNLESRRIKKGMQSDSEVVVNVLRNYSESLKDANSKLAIAQNQTKVVVNEKNQISSQLKNYTKQIDSKIKQLKKFDGDLVQKTQSIQQSSFSIQSLKNLERILQIQIKQCQGKTYDGYEYTSRSITLKTILSLIKKIMENGQELNQKSNKSSRQRTQFGIKKKTSIIEQQTSLEESDVIQQITKILDQLVEELSSQNSYESLRSCMSQKKFSNNKKVMQTPQLMKIYQRFQEVLTIFCEQEFRAIQVQKQNFDLRQRLEGENQKLSEQIQLKSSQILSLAQNIKSLEAKLRKIQLDRIQQLNKIQIEVEGKTKELEDTIQMLSNKLQLNIEELETKDKQIQQLNCKFLQRDRKVNLMTQEYKRFKKLFKNSVEKNKDRQKNIDDILQKSLSKSKASVSKTLNTTKDGSKKPKIKISPNLDEQSSSQLFQFQIIGRSGNKKQSKKQSKDSFCEIIGSLESKNSQQQKYHKTINDLSAKLTEAERKIKQYYDKIQRAQKISQNNHQYLLPQNISTLLYNIMVKIRQLPENSFVAQEIWDQLNLICQQFNGIQLLMNIEQYTVSWLVSNLVDPLQKKIREKSAQVTNLKDAPHVTPKRSPRAGNKQIQLNRTIKNPQPN